MNGVISCKLKLGWSRRFVPLAAHSRVPGGRAPGLEVVRDGRGRAITELCRAEISWVLEIFTPSPPRKQNLLAVGMGWWQVSGQDFCLKLGTPKTFS